MATCEEIPECPFINNTKSAIIEIVMKKTLHLFLLITLLWNHVAQAQKISGQGIGLIDSLGKDINRNSLENRREVRFGLTTFSNVFVDTSLEQTPLPVKLISFIVIEMDNAALLRWKTSSELNAVRFEVERSSDGREFIKIGEVEGKGSISQGAEYTHSDVDFPRTGQVIYYRLRLVDHNSYSFTKIISLRKGKVSFPSRIYPNPVPKNEDPVIEFTDPTGEILITDLLGRDLRIPATRLTPYKASLGINTLAPGTYFVKVESANGVSTQRLVIE